MTEDQLTLLRDKFVLWDRAAHDGPMDLRDYNRRAADALKALLAEQVEYWRLHEAWRTPETTTDDPDLDATDAAHPAWWRGHDHTSKVFCELVTDILDGKDRGGGFNHEPWHTLRRRLLDARRPLPSREVIAAAAYGVNPFYESGEHVDGFQVSPGGNLSWEQAKDRDAEFAGDKLMLPVTADAYAIADAILAAGREG